MKKLCLFILIFSLVFIASCQSKDGSATDTNDTADTTPTVSAEEAGIVSHGFVNETDFPANESLTEWYTNALSIETVPGSLIYAKDDTDGLWHCWVYLGAIGAQDALVFRATTDGGLCVIIDFTADPYTSGETMGAYYFTVRSDASPDFDLIIDGENEGMIITHADVSVAKS